MMWECSDVVDLFQIQKWICLQLQKLLDKVPNCRTCELKAAEPTQWLQMGTDRRTQGPIALISSVRDILANNGFLCYSGPIQC